MKSDQIKRCTDYFQHNLLGIYFFLWRFYRRSVFSNRAIPYLSNDDERRSYILTGSNIFHRNHSWKDCRSALLFFHSLVIWNDRKNDSFHVWAFLAFLKDTIKNGVHTLHNHRINCMEFVRWIDWRNPCKIIVSIYIYIYIYIIKSSWKHWVPWFSLAIHPYHLLLLAGSLRSILWSHRDNLSLFLLTNTGASMNWESIRECRLWVSSCISSSAPCLVHLTWIVWEMKSR